MSLANQNRNSEKWIKGEHSDSSSPEWVSFQPEYLLCDLWHWHQVTKRIQNWIKLVDNQLVSAETWPLRGKPIHRCQKWNSEDTVSWKKRRKGRFVCLFACFPLASPPHLCFCQVYMQALFSPWKGVASFYHGIFRQSSSDLKLIHSSRVLRQRSLLSRTSLCFSEPIRGMLSIIPHTLPY